MRFYFYERCPYLNNALPSLQEGIIICGSGTGCGFEAGGGNGGGSGSGGAPLGALLGVAVALGVLQDWRWLAALEVALGVRVSLGASPGLASPICIPVRNPSTCQRCPLLRQHSLISPPEADIPNVEEVWTHCNYWTWMVIGDLKHIEHLLTLTEFLLNTASSLI